MSSVSKIDFENDRGRFSIVTIPVLEDNYAFCLIDCDSKQGIIIDPGEAKNILPQLKSFEPVAIAATHHHPDHVDGIEELLNEIPSIKTVYGVDERIPFISKYLKDGDSFNVGSIEIFVIHHPCHTIGSASFHIKSDGHKQPDIVFTGDTLFLSGCGYFFEGTGSQMYDALYFRLGSLPGSTLVFPGHEYTINNLRFAKSIEPTNKDISSKLEYLEEQKSKGILMSIPGILADEWKLNPFMRLDSEELKNSLGIDSDEKNFTKIMDLLRSTKNAFK